MLFLFVKQSAFICRTFIKNGSGRGRNGCTKFLPRLSSYSPRHSPHAESGSVLLLPGDFFRLKPAQRAAEKILTKYNVAH